MPDHANKAPVSSASDSKSLNALSSKPRLVEGFDLDALERDLILAALEKAGGNKAQAARMLGVSRRRMYSLLASIEGGRGGEDGGAGGPADPDRG